MDDESMRFDLLAASLRADATDMPTYVESLARKLEQALPLQTSVDRRPRGFLSREKAVRGIEVNVGGSSYQLALDKGSVAATRANAVRGIVLKREPMNLEQWIEALSQALADEAGRSEQARLALQRLLGA